MTIPNLITSLRIIVVPIFVIYLLEGRLSAALVVFIAGGLSDAADGFLARVLKQKSRLGSFLDPLADKLLLIAAFIVLATTGFVPAWLGVIVISRDVLILLGVLILFLSRIDLTIAPSILSKLTTCFQLATIFVVLAGDIFPGLSFFNKYLFWGCGALTIASGLHYMRMWFRMMGESP